MAQQTGIKSQLIYVDETTLGTTPTTPVAKLLKFTEESLGTDRGLHVSASIGGERLVDTIRPGRRDTKGGISFELEANALATFFKHLLGGSVQTSGINPYTHVIKGSESLPTGGLSIEKGLLDLAQYLVFRGCRVNKAELTFPSSGFITGRFDLLAMYEGGGTGTGAGVPSGTSIDSVPDKIADLPMVDWEGAVILDTVTDNKVSDVRLTIHNAIKEDGFSVGNRDRQEMPLGQRICTGRLTKMFTSITDYTNLINQDDHSLKIKGTRGSYSVEFYFPKVVFGPGENTPKISGVAPVSHEVPFHAKKDTTEGTDVVITIINSQATI